MTEVKRQGRRAAPKKHPRALRSGISVSLALAVISSFSYPVSSSVPSLSTASSGADIKGSIVAKGIVPATLLPHTGHVGEQVLGQPSFQSPFGTTDSLVPGREVPPTTESSRAIGTVDKATAEHLSTMERPAKGTLIAPLQFLAPTSPFGMRISPITGEHGEFHSGQDFGAPCGTRVFSADAGVVRAVGWHPWGGGNRVEIDHGNGLVTTYNHLQGIAVKNGDLVAAGQVIATVGTTGSSTGCHLHFETILNGAHTDPAAWKLIPLDGSGPVAMPSLVNFAPGTGNGRDGETAWVAYLASTEPVEPTAFKSPSRVDAEIAASGTRPTVRKTSPTAGKPSSSVSLASPSPSKKSTTKASPAPAPSKPGTSSASPAGTDPTPTPPAKDTTATPPAKDTTPAPAVTDPTPTPPAAQTPAPPATETPAPPVTETPAPPVTETPAPPVTETPAPPVTETPAPPVTQTPAPPVTQTPAPPVTETPAPPVQETPPATAPTNECNTVADPANPAATVTVLVDPVTGKPVLDPVTGTTIPCTPTTSPEGTTGTEPARVTDPALAPAP